MAAARRRAPARIGLDRMRAVLMWLYGALGLLSLLPLFSSVRLTGTGGWPFLLLYAVTVLLLLAGFLLPVAAEARARIMAHRLGERLQVIAGLMLLILLVPAIAVLEGLPVVLHHLTKSPGTLEVTVTEKLTYHTRFQCQPRLRVAEFDAWFAKRALCPGDEDFRRVPVGARLRLTGKVSPFGMEPEHAVLLKAPAPPAP